MKYPTGSKLHLNELCLGWHTVDDPPQSSQKEVHPAAEFGSYLHTVAENEAKRRYDPNSLTRVERAMTAESEAIFNPHYTEDIGAPMDAESWGASIVALQDALFAQLKPLAHSEISIELTGSAYLGSNIGRIVYDTGARYVNRGYNSEAGIHGTGDLIYATDDGDLVVVDWKTGKKAISPLNNIQLMFLALAWIRSWPYPELEKSGHVWLVIGDIRTQELRFSKVTCDDILAIEPFIEKILKTTDKNSNLTPGVHCDLCPKAGNCPALLAKATKDAAKDPALLNGDELAEIAILTRKINKEYRDILIARAEQDPNFKSKYLTKGPKGWRLSAYDTKE